MCRQQTPGGAGVAGCGLTEAAAGRRKTTCKKQTGKWTRMREIKYFHPFISLSTTEKSVQKEWNKGSVDGKYSNLAVPNKFTSIGSEWKQLKVTLLSTLSLSFTLEG